MKRAETIADKKLRELINRLKDSYVYCKKGRDCNVNCPYYTVDGCTQDWAKDTLTLIDEFSKRLDTEPSVEMNLSVADQAREEALISAYKTISRVLDGSKNGPELITAIPIADYAARIAKAIEENRNMNTTAEATLALGKIVEKAAKNVPESNGGLGTIIRI